MLREEATAAGALLIFDEIMTSRLGPRGGGLEGIVPDLMTVGKYLAGGMSFGAFGGRRDAHGGATTRRGRARCSTPGTFNNNVRLDERRDRGADAACSPTTRWPTSTRAGTGCATALNRVAADAASEHDRAAAR